MTTELEDVPFAVEDSAGSEDIPKSANGHAPESSSQSEVANTVVTWESAIRVLADVEPVPAAGAAALVVVIVLS